VVEGYRGFLEACPLMPMFPNRYMQSFYGLDYLRYGDEFILMRRRMMMMVMKMTRTRREKRVMKRRMRTMCMVLRMLINRTSRSRH
jgi:hypothetical protein